MAQYVIITAEEMHEFLTAQGFVPIGLDINVREKVYAKSRVVGNDKERVPLSIRVYTTIEDGTGRGVGNDAIRVVVFGKKLDEKTHRDVPVKIMGFKRVHRVENWRQNLGERIHEAMTVKIAKCPKCGGLLVERENRQTKSPFLGCANYPECKYSSKMPGGA